MFKSRAWAVFQGFQNDKRNVLEKAISLTNDKGITLTNEILGQVILCARDFPKQTKLELERFEKITLDKWVEEVKKKQEEVVFGKSKDFVEAFDSIAARHSVFKGK